MSTDSISESLARRFLEGKNALVIVNLPDETEEQRQLVEAFANSL